MTDKTPKELGYSFPAEWRPHRATWLSWPHKEASWPGKLQSIYPIYAQFVRVLTEGEWVCINVNDEAMRLQAEQHLKAAGADLSRVQFFFHPTNDAWCRDHGPAFLLRAGDVDRKAIVDWGYNAWGGKYPPYDWDDEIPTRIAHSLNLPCFKPGIVMEGGSVEFNGKGTVLTTASCLLNPNRNPHLSREEIEKYLIQYYGVEQVLWLEEGIEGDDTDGHIDDLTRFVNEDTVVTVVEKDRNQANYRPLQQNVKALNKMRLLNGKALNVIELPMPAPYFEQGQPLPCSYANFYISNAAVIVPIFEDPQDDAALQILSECFKDRKVIGLNSRDIIWGLGSFHCLSQQEPL
ncbi:agmatine deiminase family protein [Candidatus Protochlamydia phocaeensis]|uniref:agmatine deiminase family protein n=1 Tax=Candidatus Protochlamydia phocaeensis TaxID=1414722 RepID=UPI0008383EDA|nr:agmatine deiminase family protein [Candidatus Protochlamydia phocaeensis]